MRDMNNMILVDILLVTYNQEQYIQQALEGILMQRVNPDVQVRIIVADDYSKDSTLSCIKKILGPKAKLASGNEAEVVYLSAEHNLGIAGNYKRAIAATTGDYVAVLEGDDYWISPSHLQSHLDFLEENSICVLSSNCMFVKNEIIGKFETYYPQQRNVLYSGDEQARTNRIGNLSTCVFRANYLHVLPDEMFNMEVDDWLLGLVLAQNGYIAKICTPTSVYRINSSSNWASMDSDATKERMLARIDAYNAFLGGKYAAAFSELKAEIMNDGKTRYWKYKKWIPSFITALFKWILPPACFK